MNALSISESEEANWSSDDGTEEDAGEGKHDVGIERHRVKAGLGAEVPRAEGGASESRSEETIATEDLEASVEVTEANMEDVGVVLD